MDLLTSICISPGDGLAAHTSSLEQAIDSPSRASGPIAKEQSLQLELGEELSLLSVGRTPINKAYDSQRSTMGRDYAACR